jgi:hypothetical protein
MTATRECPVADIPGHGGGGGREGAAVRQGRIGDSSRELIQWIAGLVNERIMGALRTGGNGCVVKI